MAKLGLCIGINNYPGTNNDLSGCVNDANDWSAALKARGFVVAQLLDKQATKKNMSDAMKDVVGRAISGDLVVIQYSGHGSYVPDDDDEPNEADGTDEVLCPWDLDEAHYLKDDELNAIFSARAKGVKIILVADSCYSGTVSKVMASLPGSVKKIPKQRFLPPENFLSKKQLTRLGDLRVRSATKTVGKFSSLLMAGCQEFQVSYDAYFNNRPNGAFTYAALQTLKTLPTSATYSRWFKEIRKLLPTQEYPQSPNLYGASTHKGWKVFE